MQADTREYSDLAKAEHLYRLSEKGYKEASENGDQELAAMYDSIGRRTRVRIEALGGDTGLIESEIDEN